MLRSFQGDGAGFNRWLSQRADVLRLEVEEVPLHEVEKGSSWKILYSLMLMGPHQLTALANDFLRVIGLKVVSSPTSDEPTVKKHVLFAEEGGMVGLVRDENGFFLIQARAESGHKGVLVKSRTHEGFVPSGVLAAPTVQFSNGNLRLSGANIRFAHRLVNLFPPASPKSDRVDPVRPWSHLNVERQESDGGRFFGKTNQFIIVPLTRAEAEATLEGQPDAYNYVWVDLATLVYMRKAGLVSEHLRTIMASLVEA